MIVNRSHHRIRTAQEWNAAYPEGTAVRYFPVRGDFEHVETRTRSAAWTLGDQTAVVMVEGFTGGIHLEHLVVVADPPSSSLQVAPPFTVKRDDEIAWVAPMVDAAWAHLLLNGPDPRAEGPFDLDEAAITDAVFAKVYGGGIKIPPASRRGSDWDSIVDAWIRIRKKVRSFAESRYPRATLRWRPPEHASEETTSLSTYLIEVVIGETKVRVEAPLEEASLRMFRELISPDDWPHIVELAVARQGWIDDARGSAEDRRRPIGRQARRPVVHEAAPQEDIAGKGVHDRNDDDENALP